MARSDKLFWTCSSCLRAQAGQRSILALDPAHRSFQTATRRYSEQNVPQKSPEKESTAPKGEAEQGAMSRRLSEMAEETMDTGSKSDRKMMSDAGFSADLKKQLEERIAQSAFEAESQQALSEANMPRSAGRGTRDQASAEPWKGDESLQDAALRMLDDSHKRLRTPAPRAPPIKPIIRPPSKKKVSTADRLVNARDKTSIYALSQMSDMTEEERAKMRQDLKDRFSPGARPMPATLQGLASLANERIEDAIARGQFKNIQRGKGVNTQRDYVANSPFLDTTEYFMNKIIQKQEIVPPWIEKQQELLKMVTTFRKRLRNDWRRHAARLISSQGGTVADQIRRAKSYALAEERVNPRPQTKSETMSSIDPAGNLTSITVEEKIAAGVAPDPVEDPIQIKVTETHPQETTSQAEMDAQPRRETIANVIIAQKPEAVQAASTESESVNGQTTQPSSSDPLLDPAPEPPVLPMARTFRDPSWERAESSYHNLAIAEINALARSYNLMAPKVAQKPYYTLQRELNRCYSEVAPTLPDEILERSRKPIIKVQINMHREGSVMEKFQGTGHVAKIRDEPGERGYGFKEFWKDLFRKDDEVRSGRRSRQDAT